MVVVVGGWGKKRRGAERMQPRGKREATREKMIARGTVSPPVFAKRFGFAGLARANTFVQRGSAINHGEKSQVSINASI